MYLRLINTKREKYALGVNPSTDATRANYIWSLGAGSDNMHGTSSDATGDANAYAMHVLRVCSVHAVWCLVHRSSLFKAKTRIMCVVVGWPCVIKAVHAIWLGIGLKAKTSITCVGAGWPCVITPAPNGLGIGMKPAGQLVWSSSVVVSSL